MFGHSFSLKAIAVSPKAFPAAMSQHDDFHPMMELHGVAEFHPLVETLDRWVSVGVGGSYRQASGQPDAEKRGKNRAA
jgi:hypothetical protein